MNKRFSSRFGVQGGSSLLVIFGVLCLIVFCMLALISAMAGGRLGDASLDATTSYYCADSLAEQKLAQLREEGIDGQYDFSIDISERQSLNVSVLIKDGSYKILKWQAQHTSLWNANTNFDLWSGN